MHYKVSYWIMRIGLIADVILAAFYLSSHEKLYFWLVLGIAAACIIQGALFYRCPVCGESLSLYQKMPEKCPNCGKPLK